MKKILCIIPARQNSKRLIGKNNKIFFNKPLVFWTLRFASKLDYIAKIIFTSDSKKILDIAKPFKNISRQLRLKKLAKDNTLMKDVVSYVLEKDGRKYDGLLILQPTTPFRNLEKFNLYLSKFNNNNYYSVTTKQKSNHKCYIKDKKLFFNKKGRICYQTGSLILVSCKNFLKKNSLHINNSIPVISNNKYENFDIDKLTDFNASFNSFRKKRRFNDYFLNRNL